ncbi:hypothetical protein LCGC14_0634310 [marine sediment metagenome]|uniref:Uncharacterized protein n=1 Tax=marine sediment metagenome TaxID=412755 RepID=A0A0F9R6C6_9ZZZZ
MSPELAELLGLENPYARKARPRKSEPPYACSHLDYGEEAWNRALEDAWEKMGFCKIKLIGHHELLHNGEVVVEGNGPGTWIWIQKRVVAHAGAACQ